MSSGPNPSNRRLKIRLRHSLVSWGPVLFRLELPSIAYRETASPVMAIRSEVLVLTRDPQLASLGAFSIDPSMVMYNADCPNFRATSVPLPRGVLCPPSAAVEGGATVLFMVFGYPPGT